MAEQKLSEELLHRGMHLDAVRSIGITSEKITQGTYLDYAKRAAALESALATERAGRELAEARLAALDRHADGMHDDAMSTTVSFHCPGVAKSERKRQRFIPGKGNCGHRTDEPDRADFKSRLAAFAAKAFSEPLEGPVGLSLQVFRPQPNSYPKKPTNGNPWPWADVKRPDADNYAKICQDAMNGIAFRDDSQIIDLRVSKAFGPHGVRVTVWTIEAPAEESVT